jgi:hypothetical protein
MDTIRADSSCSAYAGGVTEEILFLDTLPLGVDYGLAYLNDCVQERPLLPSSEFRLSVSKKRSFDSWLGKTICVQWSRWKNGAQQKIDSGKYCVQVTEKCKTNFQALQTKQYPELSPTQTLHSIFLEVDSLILQKIPLMDSVSSALISVLDSDAPKCAQIWMPAQFLLSLSEKDLFILQKWRTKNQLQFDYLDTLFDEQSRDPRWHVEKMPLEQIHACSIRLSSQTDSVGATVLLFNSHPYRIATRPDGSLVLRKVEEEE